jgi:hypothetical protein
MNKSDIIGGADFYEADENETITTPYSTMMETMNFDKASTTANPLPQSPPLEVRDNILSLSFP